MSKKRGNSYSRRKLPAVCHLCMVEHSYSEPCPWPEQKPLSFGNPLASEDEISGIELAEAIDRVLAEMKEKLDSRDRRE